MRTASWTARWMPSGRHLTMAILLSSIAHAAQPIEKPAAAPPQTPAPTKLLVTCKILPDDANLTVDTEPVPCSPKVPCATYLSPGIHKVVVKDPKGRYPSYIREVKIDAREHNINVDLSSQLAKLAIASDRPILVSLDGGSFVETSKFVLKPGPHEVQFRSKDDRCLIPQPASYHVILEEKTEHTARVEWKAREPDVIYIEPMLRIDGQKVAAADAIVSIDDKVQNPYDGGTGYRVGCDVTEIRVTRPAFFQAKLALPSAEASLYVGKDKPWTPELAQTYLTGRHVDCHEVTVGEYEEYRNSENPKELPRADAASLTWGSTRNREHSRYPVNGLSYEAAKSFCEWRARQDERARDARVASAIDLREAAGYNEHHIYPWVSAEHPTCERVQMYERGKPGCGDGRPAQVCSKPQGNGPYGHCDLLGNVAEWVSSGSSEVRRHKVFGGGFRNGIGGSAVLNMGVNPVFPENTSSDNVGFRCAWRIGDRDTCACEDVDHVKHSARTE